MEFVIVLLVLAVVVFVVTAPLRRERPSRAQRRVPAERLAELEAAATRSTVRSATPSSIIETGKLSDADYEQLDRTLRAEAVEIMHAIDGRGRAEGTGCGGRSG